MYEEKAVECNVPKLAVIVVLHVLLVMPSRRPCSPNVTFLRHSICTFAEGRISTIWATLCLHYKYIYSTAEN